mgnify:CR=1 FL=1
MFSDLFEVVEDGGFGDSSLGGDHTGAVPHQSEADILKIRRETPERLDYIGAQFKTVEIGQGDTFIPREILSGDGINPAGTTLGCSGIQWTGDAGGAGCSGVRNLDRNTRPSRCDVEANT